MRASRICQTCGIQFTPRKTGPGRGIYCSVRCRAVAGGRTQAARGRRGEQNQHAKLTEAAVRWALVAETKGLTQQQIAERLGVCQTAISKALRGENWGWVTTR